MKKYLFLNNTLETIEKRKKKQNEELKHQARQKEFKQNGFLSKRKFYKTFILEIGGRSE